MEQLKKVTLLFVLICSFCDCTRGDGKIFISDTIPADIPYQRAFLIFNEGTETLILQSKYEFSHTSDVNSLGWIVPVPAVPDIGSVDADIAKTFFFQASFGTQPEVTRISSYVSIVIMSIFIFGFAVLVVCLIEYPFLYMLGTSKVTWSRRTKNSLAVTLVSFALVIFTMPSLSRSLAGVDIIKAEKAGIYDIKVITSETAEPIMEWLRENSFNFDDNDTEVFQDYIDRNWCFVVAKVGSDTKVELDKVVTKGMVAPLILKFKTEKAIYPLALTSTIGTDTEVLLFTLSKDKFTCNERLTLKHAKSLMPVNWIDHLLIKADQKTCDLFSDIPKKPMFICKFKKKLSPEQMKQDLELEYAPDNNPYVKKIVRW